MLQDRCTPGRTKMKKIFVTVSGGVAYVCDDTVPAGYDLELIDFDNIQAGASYPSAEAHAYCKAKGLSR